MWNLVWLQCSLDSAPQVIYKTISTLIHVTKTLPGKHDQVTTYDWQEGTTAGTKIYMLFERFTRMNDPTTAYKPEKKNTNKVLQMRVFLGGLLFNI